MLPIGIHDATLSDVRERFASNALRIRLFDKFDDALKNWQSLPSWNAVDAVYMDGSFLTDKPAPGDIECAIAINPNAVFHEAIHMMEAVNDARKKSDAALDCYSFVPGLSNDFSTFFQYMRRSDADARHMKWSPSKPMKGIIRLAR